VADTWTWDEAACRARLAAAAKPYDVIACRELDRHVCADLQAALAEIDRLRAALRPFAGFARSGMDPARMPTVADFEAAAAALGGLP
jgi:hypothetical protein